MQQNQSFSIEIPDISEVLAKLEENDSVSSAPSLRIRRRRRKPKIEEEEEEEEVEGQAEQLDGSSSSPSPPVSVPLPPPSTTTPVGSRGDIATCQNNKKPSFQKATTRTPNSPKKNLTKSKRRQRWREKLRAKRAEEEEEEEEEDTKKLKINEEEVVVDYPDDQKDKNQENTPQKAKRISQPELSSSPSPEIDPDSALPPEQTVETPPVRVPLSIENWLSQSHEEESWSSVIVTGENDRSKSRVRRWERHENLSEDVDDIMGRLEEYLAELERLQDDKE
ncbi:hypothetical protein AA313_de0200529 [Arthrobotrys entomopaga]|nr:hypothetical protein AA313_de0200529 [Arthrobotrys entomopaga]